MNAIPVSTPRPFALALCCALLAGCASAPEIGPGSWEPLLDDDLTQWEMYLGYKLPAGYDGAVPTGPDGEALAPVGYNNNVNQVYSVSMATGDPVLRISGEYYGTLFTKRSYENYHLTLEVRWGELTWDPRKALLRDTGILYHSIGENGIDYFRAWKRSQEFQIMEGHMGDYWSIAGTAADVRAYLPERSMNAVASTRRPFIPIAEDSPAGGFCMRSADFESDYGEWTRLDLIAFGDKSLHLVNGEVVMVLRNSRYTEQGETHPLIGGQIQLQSEAAEVFYRDIRIRSLDALPEAYAPWFE
ncbi:MAG: DUF1080 domain-containing protein [Rhodothermales bacterium]